MLPTAEKERDLSKEQMWPWDQCPLPQRPPPHSPPSPSRLTTPSPARPTWGARVASSGRPAPQVRAATQRGGQTLRGLAGVLPRQACLGGGVRPRGTCAARRGSEDPPPSRAAAPRPSTALLGQTVRRPPRARALGSGEGARGVRSAAQSCKRRRGKLQARRGTSPPSARAVLPGSARPSAAPSRGRAARGPAGWAREQRSAGPRASSPERG